MALPSDVFRTLEDIVGSENIKDMGKRVRKIPVLVDLEAQFRIMDQFNEYVQVSCLASPPLEVIRSPEIAAGLAKVANDGMAK